MPNEDYENLIARFHPPCDFRERILDGLFGGLPPNSFWIPLRLFAQIPNILRRQPEPTTRRFKKGNRGFVELIPIGWLSSQATYDEKVATTHRLSAREIAHDGAHRHGKDGNS